MVRSRHFAIRVPLICLTMTGVVWGLPIDRSISELGAGGSEAPAPAVASAAVDFPANGIELLSWLPLSEFGAAGGGGADCWGYTSPSGREYAIIGLSGGTGFVEITDPGDAQVVAVVAAPSSIWRDIKVYQDHAYTINENSGGLQVIDMSQIDAGIVTEVGSINTPGTSATHNIAINEESGFLYRIGGGGGTVGLRIYDLSNPDVPTFVGEWHDRYIHDAQVVTYHGGPFDGREIAFCFSETGSGGGFPGVDILDVTDKSNITSISFIQYSAPRAFSHQGWLSPDRQHLYVNDELDELNFGVSTNMRILDVSDLTAPFEAATYTNGTAAIDHNLYTKDNLIFAANYRSGLRVFDATDPIAPFETAFFDTYPADDAAAFNGLWSTFPYFDSGVVIGSDIERGLFVWWLGPRLLAYSYPSGRPDLVHPDGQSLQVSITEQGGGALDESTLRFYRDFGTGFVSAPLTSLGGGLYEVEFPASQCGGSVSYYFSGQTTNGITWRDPPSAPATAYTAPVAIAQTVESIDDLETDTFWTVGAPSDTANTGVWVRVDPVGTGAQPEDDHTDAPGTMCWVTGQGSVGGGLGANDVDGGATTLFSPALDVQLVSNPKIGYWRWYSNNAGGSPNADVFVVDISNDGINWTNVETVGPSGSDTGGGWVYHEFLVTDFADSSVPAQLRFIADDAGDGSIVEAAIDDLQIISVDCGFDGVPPLAASAPLDVPKNRYVSFSPNNGAVGVAFGITLPGNRPAWVGEPQLVDWGGSDAASVSVVVDAPVVRVWDEDVVHVTGCVIAPNQSYAIRASDGVSQFTSVLTLVTVPNPGVGSWADVVGSFDAGAWTAPNGVVNFSDISAAIKKFQQDAQAVHVTVVDLDPQWPNYAINFNDIGMVVSGFQAVPYPVAAGDFQTISDCPLGAAP